MKKIAVNCVSCLFTLRCNQGSVAELYIYYDDLLCFHNIVILESINWEVCAYIYSSQWNEYCSEKLTMSFQHYVLLCIMYIKCCK